MRVRKGTIRSRFNAYFLDGLDVLYFKCDCGKIQGTFVYIYFFSFNTFNFSLFILILFHVLEAHMQPQRHY